MRLQTLKYSLTIVKVLLPNWAWFIKSRNNIIIIPVCPSIVSIRFLVVIVLIRRSFTIVTRYWRSLYRILMLRLSFESIAEPYRTLSSTKLGLLLSNMSSLFGKEEIGTDILSDISTTQGEFSNNCLAPMDTDTDSLSETGLRLDFN